LLQPGDIAPDFELQTAEGQSVSLSGSLRDGRSILLVFLRHLG
jgi:peroxiredoxin